MMSPPAGSAGRSRELDADRAAPRITSDRGTSRSPIASSLVMMLFGVEGLATRHASGVEPVG